MTYQHQYDPAPCYTLAGGLKLDIKNEGEFIIFSEIYMHHEYRDPVIHLLGSLPQDRPVQIVDLGTNVGYFTWYAASAMLVHKIPFKITCVEAHPVVYGELMKRLGENAQIPATAYCGLMGGQTSGHGILLDNGNHHTLSRVFQPEPNHVVTTPHINVQYLDPRVILPTGPIDLLKMDIEGAEFNFIREFPEILGRVNRLVVEIHHVLDLKSEWEHQLTAVGLQRVHTKQTGNVSTQFWRNIRLGDPTLPHIPAPSPSGPPSR